MLLPCTTACMFTCVEPQATQPPTGAMTESVPPLSYAFMIAIAVWEAALA